MFARQESLPLFESEDYLTKQLVTYLGNKRALLPFLGKAIAQVQRRLGRGKLRVADLFAGSGVVSRYLKQHASYLLSNDLEAYAEVIARCYLANASEVDWPVLRRVYATVLETIERDWAPGPITAAYAPKDEAAITPEDRVFYTRRNAIYLDSARRAIEAVPPAFRDLLLAPLLAEASVHNNTSGVFKGFYKNRQGIGCYGGEGRNALQRILGDIRLQLPILSNFECDVDVRRGDANALAKAMPAVDLAYLDPPYNQHPYGSNYFMLNLLVTGKPPVAVSRVSGIPTDWNRSRYNKRPEAQDALFTLIRDCPATHILISYNSEGFIPRETFMSELSQLGSVTPFATEYNTFRGCRNLASRPIKLTEYLFLLEKSDVR